MRRECSLCKKVYGCYTPEKRSCSQCRLAACPCTREVTHGICPSCWEKEVETWRDFCRERVDEELPEKG